MAPPTSKRRPRIFVLAARYPFVISALLVTVVAGVLLATPGHLLVPWLLGTLAVTVGTRSAWRIIRDLRSGSIGIDVIAVLAITSSVVVGEYWAAAVIAIMITSGEALEDYAVHRAEGDLSALLSQAPRKGHRLTAGGSTVDVAIEDIVPGERIIVRPGEVVGVDGRLESDAGVFDDSSLTGESVPVERVTGDEILSGSVNGSVAVVLRVTRAAKDSQYAQIVALVEAATASKSPMVRLADRFALPFTGIALLVAGFAWWSSGDPVRFAEVLVVATPCPMIIAAPVAFLAGLSRSARAGMIIKDGAVLEKLHRARAVAFDKTGTLTEGVPSLISIRPAGAMTVHELLELSASAEQYSAHVLAGAVIRAAGEAGLCLTGAEQAEESTANGVTATIGTRHVVVGKRSFVAGSTGCPMSATPLDPGEMAIYVAVDGIAAGALVFRDSVRHNARSTVDRLRDRGIRKILMITGDDRPTAEHVAAAVGIDDIRSNCLPAAKVEAVTSLSERPVVMAGDGVNDAPVLAAADVGIAMGARGSTSASQSADIVLLRDDVSDVARVLEIGRQTVDIALQSLWIGIGLSLGLMITAAFGLLPALAGAWLQEGVDVISILWALRAIRGSPSGPTALTR